MKVLAWPAFRNRKRNPYTWKLYSEIRKHGVSVDEFSPFRLLSGKYDIVHIHWPERVLHHRSRLVGWIGSAVLLGLLRLARRRGARVIWTVHNLQTHEQHRPRLESVFWKFFPRTLDGVITLTSGAHALACEQLPDVAARPAFVVPHGHYRGAYPNDVDAATARDMLAVPREAKVAAYVGAIRNYKNVPQLIRVFRAAAEEGMILLVAGRPQSRMLEAEIIEATAGDPRVRTFLGFVPEERLQVFFKAADLIVLPYTDILNSGSALLALSFDRPVLLPDKGAMSELQAEVGKAWVCTFPGDFDEDALRSALAWAASSSRADSPSLDRFRWEELARKTVRAYGSVCQCGSRLGRSDERRGAACTEQ